MSGECNPVLVSSDLILPAGSIISVHRGKENKVQVTYRNYKGDLMMVVTNHSLLEVYREWTGAMK
jgi:hypothetical protein